MHTPAHRNSGSSRVALLCLVAAVVGAGATLYFTQKQKAALQAELSALRENARQKESKATDPKEVEKLRAQLREVAELKKEAEEVHRLRGEVTLLRKTKTQFEQASTEIVQLRAQTTAGHEQPKPARTPQQIAAAQSQGQPVTLDEENLKLRHQYQNLVISMQRAEQERAFASVPPEQQAVARANACIANLKQMDGATQQWALETRKAAGDATEVEQIRLFLKWESLPLCPMGGAYRLTTAGQSPTCSVHGMLPVATGLPRQ